MADVFVSYKKLDRERVVPLVRALEREGFSVWWDYAIESGDNWLARIIDEVSAARCLVGFWTGNALNAKKMFVASEKDGINYLDIEHKTAGLNRIAGAMMDRGAVPVQYDDLQAADLTSWTPDEPDHPGFIQLIDQIVRITSPPAVTGRLRQATLALERAEANLQTNRAELKVVSGALRKEQKDAAELRIALDRAQQRTADAEERAAQDLREIIDKAETRVKMLERRVAKQVEQRTKTIAVLYEVSAERDALRRAEAERRERGEPEHPTSELEKSEGENATLRARVVEPHLKNRNMERLLETPRRAEAASNAKDRLRAHMSAAGASTRFPRKRSLRLDRLWATVVTVFLVAAGGVGVLLARQFPLFPPPSPRPTASATPGSGTPTPSPSPTTAPRMVLGYPNIDPLLAGRMVSGFWTHDSDCVTATRIRVEGDELRIDRKGMPAEYFELRNANARDEGGLILNTFERGNSRAQATQLVFHDRTLEIWHGSQVDKYRLCELSTRFLTK